MSRTRYPRPSTITKHSIVVNGRETSVTLEEGFWRALKEIAIRHGTTVSSLACAIDLKRDHRNLSSALRVFVLDFYRSQN